MDFEIYVSVPDEEASMEIRTTGPIPASVSAGYIGLMSYGNHITFRYEDLDKIIEALIRTRDEPYYKETYERAKEYFARNP